MKVLWFEVTEPSAYVSDGNPPIAGWQDSLERIIRGVPDIDLYIAFVSKYHSQTRIIDGVTYIPMSIHWHLFERIFYPYWDIYVKKMLPQAKKIIETIKPDLIHIFGTEWPFGQVAAFTEIPVVIHLMGSIVPYYNAYYPPGYSFGEQLSRLWRHPKTFLSLYMTRRDMKSWEQWEHKTWNLVSCYMGRTHWDESLSRILHPGRRYFHVDEALRFDFITGTNSWRLQVDNKVRLVSIGCSSFWKGPDMMLKGGRILTELGVDFEWNVAGSMPQYIQKVVEAHEGASFHHCHIHLLGFKKPDELLKVLCSSSMYVHTAYIENSPNSICEAQCLGLPVVSTNVGGISSLVRQNIDGILVPANDPWQMADAIIQLANNKDLMLRMSKSGREFAMRRHSDSIIKQQLRDCYMQILDNQES